MRLFKRKLSAKQKAALARLADGIECGAALRPQGFQSLFPMVKVEEDSVRASCALGAAWECHLEKQGKIIDFEVDAGVGKIDYDDILKAYGVNNRASDRVIVLGDEIVASARTADLVEIIWTMNDVLRWSRERIAQFLREAE